MLTPHFSFLDLANHPGDVRNEIRKYGREDGYKKYAEQQRMKMKFIQSQRGSGLGALFGGGGSRGGKGGLWVDGGASESSMSIKTRWFQYLFKSPFFLEFW